MSPAAEFQASLVQALERVLVQEAPGRNLDVAIYEAVMETPTLDWNVLAPGVERILREVQERLVGPLCGQRKKLHRAWIRGIVVGLVRRGMGVSEAIIPLIHLALLTSYDEGIQATVFSLSCGWGVGQGWAIASRDGAERAQWKSSLMQGVTLAIGSLKRRENELIPKMVPDDARILGAANNGFDVGSLRALTKPPF